MRLGGLILSNEVAYMSANEPPTPDDVAANTPISAAEAQMIADAMTPVQDIAGVGSSFGSAFENAPGVGPQLVGSVLQTIALQVDLASNSAEAVARGIDFYITAQTGTMEELFPPPEQLAEQLRDEAMLLRDLTESGPP